MKGRDLDDPLGAGLLTYDNLNRMTSSPKLFGSGSTSWAYTNDILGNRTWRNNVYSGTGATRYDWDIVNRMLLCANATSGSTYSYRADGQRIEKVDGVTLSWTGNRESGHYDTNYATSRPTYRYFYDGQMGIEDDYNPSGTVTKVNRYGLGARGIDRIEAWDGTNTTYGYPLYDGHGNMRGTLGRSGSSYSTGNWRTYDVWGGVRSGNGTGDPKQRYCANLGHVQDDESGLIYMRARYHEPATGRFISQDPAMDGTNWYVYCDNSPNNLVDRTGKYNELPVGSVSYFKWMIGFTLGSLVVAGLLVWFDYYVAAALTLITATFFAGQALGATTKYTNWAALVLASPTLIGCIHSILLGLKPGSTVSGAQAPVFYAAMQAIFILAALIDLMFIDPVTR